MFQFRRFPSHAYLIQRGMTAYCAAGLPHSEIPGSMDICSSPRLIAACHVPSSAPDAKAFPLRSFQLDLLVAKSAWLRFRRQPSGFRRKLHPLPSSSLFAENWFSANGGRELRPCSELSENSWFSLRIMQAYKDSKLYVTLHPFGCCSTINLLRRMSPYNASLLPYLLCHIVQFSRCRSPTAFAVRFEDPIFRSGLQIQRQIAWWARVGSNHRPYDYQSYALAS